MNRKLQLAGQLGLAALLAAFLLRDVVEQLLIRPAFYLFWVLGVLYRYIPQPVLWLLMVLVLVYLALGRLAGTLEIPGPPPRRHRKAHGPVAELATQIAHRQDGIYFKWQIARTLGQIAMDIQELRLHIHSRRLEQDGAAIPTQVYRFLEAGLNTSFSDYPLPGGLRWPGKISLPGISNATGDAVKVGSPAATPFDGELGPVIDYLESKMENDDGLRRT
ncbi:MAG TPA: hypothetical protein VGK00_17555 [Anaerolineales bacterium]|jgi:hypothetical protein